MMHEKENKIMPLVSSCSESNLLSIFLKRPSELKVDILE